MIARPQRYVRFVRADVEPLTPDECRARVELQLPEWSNFVGFSGAVCSAPDTLRAAAEASLKALSQAMGTNEKVALTGVEYIDVFGKGMVLVQLSITQDDEVRSVVGVCLAGDNPTRAAALAVLNAANRSLGSG
jgi:hypothetical protein